MVVWVGWLVFLVVWGFLLLKKEIKDVCSICWGTEIPWDSSY